MGERRRGRGGPADGPLNQAEGEAVREEIDLFGSPEVLFGCRHLPSEASGGGVLVCLGPPFDTAVDEGRSARLARRLAGAGVAVQRFRYRGTWPSDGDPSELTFDRLVDDARSALDLLRDRTGVRRVAFVGARLGALVAARLARDVPGAPVVLWSPVPDARSALELAARARAARGAHDSADDRATDGPHPGDPAADDGTDGALPAPDPLALHLVDPPAPEVDLFDTPLAVDLAGSTVRSLADELGAGPRPLLVVDTADDGWADDRETVVASCRARGVAVDVAKHPCDGERAGRIVPTRPADELIDDTAAWLAARLGPPTSTAPGAGGPGEGPDDPGVAP
jgi:acetyl esterase/lipase